MSLEDKIGVSFDQKRLLEEALTHPSITRQRKAKEGRIFNYERLEFLGDAVLGLVVAELLLDRYPEEQEGELAKRQSALVRGETLVKVAREIGLGEHMIMTQGEEQTGGRENHNNLENVLEAIIGAIFLDKGLDVSRKFIVAHWGEIITNMKAPPKDSKTHLQEIVQKMGLPVPEYRTLETVGPSHSPLFTVEVSFPGVGSVKATGKSKKKAEKEAAKLLLERLEKEGKIG